MIKKLFWILILLAVVYTLGVFYTPSVTDSVGKQLGISGYNEFIKSFKWNLDQVSTDIPTKNELVEWSKAALSGALDIKDTVIGTITDTKGKIDSVRSTLSWAESTYNDAKDTFDQAKDFVEWASEKVQKVQETLNNVSELWENITNLVDTDVVDAVIEGNNN